MLPIAPEHRERIEYYRQRVIDLEGQLAIALQKVQHERESQKWLGLIAAILVALAFWGGWTMAWNQGRTQGQIEGRAQQKVLSDAEHSLDQSGKIFDFPIYQPPQEP